MPEPTQHARYEHRVPVDPSAGAEALAREIDALLVRAPSVSVERRGAVGIALRREPPLLLGLVCAAMLLLGAMGHTLAAHGPRRFAVRALPWVIDACALAAGVLAVAEARARFELLDEGDGTLRVRVFRGRRTVSDRRHVADDVTAALIVGGASDRRVVLVGPRNVELVVLLRERAMDPPTLARWLAEVAARIASHAATVRSP